MKTFTTFFFVTICISLHAQNISSTWCDGKEYAMMRYYRGDTIRVSCDTAFLINTATYNLYAGVFRNFNSRNTDVKRLTLLFDQSKNLYENRIQQQSLEYQALKKQFDDLVAESKNVVQETGTRLTSVDNSLIRIDKNVVNAQANIEEVKSIIRKEMRLSNARKLKWGAGGLLVGLVIGGVVFGAVR